MSIVGKNIRRLRREKQIHPQQVASELGRTYQQLINYESGRTMPNEIIIRKARAILGTTYDELFKEGTNAKASENK